MFYPLQFIKIISRYLLTLFISSLFCQTDLFVAYEQAIIERLNYEKKYLVKFLKDRHFF
jgi:hypothetical protein